MNVTNSKPRLSILVSIGVWLLAAWNEARAQDFEPTYNGKPESYWINSLRYSPFANGQQPRIDALGSNAVTVLLKAVAMQDGTNAAAIRINAASLLMEKADSETLVSLSKNNRDPQVRANIVKYFCYRRDKAATVALAEASQDESPIVRLEAVLGLGHTLREQTPEQIPALVRCLTDADLDICYLAASSLCQSHINFPGQDQRVIAEAASAEIKRAINHRNAVVKSAATKAINAKNSYADLRAFADELAISLSESGGQTWFANVHAIDESGIPIEGADVSVTYFIPAIEGGDTWSSWSKIEGKTGSNGVFTASHRDSSRELNFLVQKAGFSPERKKLEKNGIHPAGNGEIVKFLLPSASSYFQTASNLDLTVTVTLKKMNSTK